MTDVAVERDLAIANRTDPFGKRWEIKAVEGGNLYKIVEFKNEEFVDPRSYPKDSGLEGMFTKTVLAEQAIDLYLMRAWDFSEDKERKAPGKARRKKELAESATEQGG